MQRLGRRAAARLDAGRRLTLAPPAGQARRHEAEAASLAS
jgi:hypothetical protein